MRVLLDTHARLWWVADSRRLSESARGAIRNEANDVVVSAVSAWEIATKHRLVAFGNYRSRETRLAL